MRIGSIGEVRREGEAFTAEIRSLSHALDQERGRIFRATCDADLGDARCSVDLDSDDWTASATVVGDRRLRARCVASVPGDRPTGFFDQGALTFTSGANAGRKSEVLRHMRDDDGDHRAVAGDGGRDRGGRRVHRLRRLRQALFDLPRPLRQRREFSRLPADAGERLRALLSDAGKRERRRELGVSAALPSPDSSPTGGPPSPASGEGDPRADRRGGARLDRHAVSASGGAEGRRLRLPRAADRRVAGADGRRQVGCAAALHAGLGRGEWARDACGGAARASDEIDPQEAREGDIVLFRWRAHLPAKHAGS